MVWAIGSFLVACFVVLILFMMALAAAIVMRLMRNSQDARKYRELIAEYEKLKSQQPIQSGWKLTYKDGRKIRSVLLPGNTESEAIAAAGRMAIRYDRIESLVKVD